MELQTAFYIIGIVFMGLMLVLTLIVLADVLIIRTKISKLHDALDDRLNQARKITRKAGLIFRTVQYFMGR